MSDSYMKGAMDASWSFHKEQWGDLVVSVMPLTTSAGCIDSNVGLVVEAPFHESLISQLVVKDGRRPQCDRAVANWHVTGDRSKKWQDVQKEVYAVPKLKMKESDKNDAYRHCVKIAGKGTAEQVLGWGCYSVGCEHCQVHVASNSPEGCLQELRTYGWGIDAAGKFVCPAHAIYGPLPDSPSDVDPHA